MKQSASQSTPFEKFDSLLKKVIAVPKAVIDKREEEYKARRKAEKKMAREKPLEITVTKLDGARRHIEAAILLWFQDADPCVVVTVIAAGHHVCNDLTKEGKKSHGKSPFMLNPSLIEETMWKDWQHDICEAENFFKHANQKGDNTPDCTVTFMPDMNEYYIIDAVELFKMLHGDYTHLMKAFRLRFALFHPHGFPDFAPHLNQPNNVKLRLLTKAEFLNETLKAIAIKGGVDPRPIIGN